MFLLSRLGLGALPLLPGLAKVELASRICVVTAIAALGIKTALKALSVVGGGHLVLVVLEMIVLLGLAIAALRYLELV